MKFFPGQRIKKVRGRDSIGALAVVVGYLSPIREAWVADDHDLEIVIVDHAVEATGVFIDPDTGKRVEVPEAARPGQLATTRSEDWEPEIPPGQKTVEEEGELWLTGTEELAQ